MGGSGRRVRDDYNLILASVRAGKISPARALWWARQAAAGEPIGVLASMTAPPGPRAAVPARLASQLLDILVTGAPVRAAMTSTGEELTDEEWLRLFGRLPGHEEEPKTHLVYPGEQQGQPNRQGVTWDGYIRAAQQVDDLGDDMLYLLLFPPEEP